MCAKLASSKDPNRLPLHGLAVFESVARNGSMSAAAKALGLTQPAVSQTLKKLEQQLEITLLKRHRNGIELTKAGQELFMSCVQSFDQLAGTINTIRQPKNDQQEVTLSLSTATATYWLLPRIADFYQHYPNTLVNIISRDNDSNLNTSSYDLAIPLASQKLPEQDFHIWPLLEEVVFPVCSPTLLVQRQLTAEQTGIKTLQELPLIHLDNNRESRMSWQDWVLATSQQPQLSLIEEPIDPHFNRGQTCSDYFVAVAAAIAGQGVALGWQHIVKDLLDDQRLVRLGNAHWRSEQPFTLIAPRRKALTPAVIALKDWLLQQTL
ncbi:MAG: LysR substrate-binding domain-containing protein [Gammaproteobacteria bacterium]|nr:LysR substrate-binding domain-containing protein [Gammaproteobacteria bacterium]